MSAHFFTGAFIYVISDQYFWPSMAFTTIIGMFIGALLYNGNVEQVRKMVISLGAYAMLISMTIFGRITTILPNVSPTSSHLPFASLETIFIVTAFYLFGASLGVMITQAVQKRGGVKKYGVN